VKRPAPRWSGLFERDSFSRQIVFGVFPAVVLLVFLMGTFSYYLVRRHILAGVQTEINAMAQQASLSLEAFFQQRANDLESLSETPLIKDYLKNVEFGLVQEAALYRQELDKYFRNFAQRSGAYDDILFVRPDGAVVSSARARPGGRFRTGLPDFFRELRAGRSVRGALERPEAGGPLLMRYAQPVFDEQRTFQGAVVLDSALENAYENLRRMRVGERGAVRIEGPGGEPLLGSRPEFREPLVGTAAMPSSGLRVVVSAGARDFLGPLEQIKYLTLFFSVSAFFIVLLLILPRVSALVAPVRDMVEGTQRFAAGDLAYRFPEPASRELRILAASFNKMAQSLEERTLELLQRVRQLTALREMDGAVIQRLDEEAILKTCLESVARGFGFDRTGLYWIDPERREISGRSVYGMDRTLSEEEFRRRRLPLDGDDILCDVVRGRKAALVKDLADPRLNARYFRETKTREFVLAPICGKDKVWGVLAADNYYSGRGLRDSDKEGLMLFANAVGLALENAMLFEGLAESEARNRSILENSPVAIVGLSREHWIQTWNRGAENIFGYSAKEITGKPLAALFAPGAEQASARLLSEVMSKGSIRDFPMPGAAKDGRRLELSLSWGGPFPDFWMNKEWTVVIRDVTEARKLQQQIIRSEKLTAVGQLISGIAHELNNPLQAVVGYAEVLSEDLKSPGAARGLAGDLKVITENAVRCRKIIDNLLLFVRQGEAEKRPVRLEKAARASLDLLDYKLRKAANVAVSLDIPRGLPPVRANFQQLQQVFVNLINNACDAMAPSPGKKSIAVRAARLNERVRVEVEDSGPGIAPEAVGRLFEPFFTTKPEGRGTGLGLAVCRQILEEHGGAIGCDSVPGRGATFWFELPSSSESGGTAAGSGVCAR
jgi:PAS domain S-box-containing protein